MHDLDQIGRRNRFGLLSSVPDGEHRIERIGIDGIDVDVIFAFKVGRKVLLEGGLGRAPDRQVGHVASHGSLAGNSKILVPVHRAVGNEGSLDARLPRLLHEQSCRLIETGEFKEIGTQRLDLREYGRVVVGGRIDTLVVEHLASLLLELICERLREGFTEGLLIIQNYRSLRVELLRGELSLDDPLERVIAGNTDEIGEMQGSELRRARIIAEKRDAGIFENPYRRHRYVAIEKPYHRVHMSAHEVVRTCDSGCRIGFCVPGDHLDLVTEYPAVIVDVVDCEFLRVERSDAIRGVRTGEREPDPE